MSVTAYSAICATCRKPVERVDARGWVSVGETGAEVRHVEFVVSRCEHCADLIYRMGVAEARGGVA